MYTFLKQWLRICQILKEVRLGGKSTYLVYVYFFVSSNQNQIIDSGGPTDWNMNAELYVRYCAAAVVGGGVVAAAAITNVHCVHSNTLIPA